LTIRLGSKPPKHVHPTKLIKQLKETTELRDKAQIRNLAAK